MMPKRLIAFILVLAAAHASARKFPCQIQAHRGGAGNYPENTVVAMKNAIDLGVDVLEMDVQVSRDLKAVVSHDHYFNYRYTTSPDGTELKAEDKKPHMYRMPYDSIRKYDVGMKYDARFPKKRLLPAVRPTLSELVDSVEAYSMRTSQGKMVYSIELKSRLSKWEGRMWPKYNVYADLTIGEFTRRGIEDRLMVQSFDVRVLEYVHEKYPSITIVYNIKSDSTSTFDSYMKLLSFTPEYICPKYTDRTIVKSAHKRGIKVLPWYADTREQFMHNLSIGVDGMITNYPDSVMEWKRQYVEGKMKIR